MNLRVHSLSMGVNELGLGHGRAQVGWKDAVGLGHRTMQGRVSGFQQWAGQFEPGECVGRKGTTHS